MDNISTFQYRPNSPKSIPKQHKQVISTESISIPKINIYYESAHITEKHSQNTSTVMLPKSIDVGSIIVISNSGKILPFSYIPATTLEGVLNNKAKAKVTKNGEMTDGRILSITSDNITLIKDDIVTKIRHYDKVDIPFNEDIIKPKLVFGTNTPPFTISYLLNSIRWTCMGTILISKNKDIMYLRLAADVTNAIGDDISGQVSIVSGKMYSRKNKNYSVNETLSYAPTAKMIVSDKVSTSPLEDYISYQVGNKTLKQENIIELGSQEFPFLRVYIHQIDGDTVLSGYRFTSPDYLPSCSIDIYSTNDDMSIDSYVGSSDVEEKQKGDEVDIIIGETSKLQCVSNVVISNDVIINTIEEASKYRIPFVPYKDNRGTHIVTEDISVEITNFNSKPSLLILKHYIGNKQVVDLQCASYKNRRNGYLEWYFEIEPNKTNNPDKKNFMCKVVTSSYY